MRIALARLAAPCLAGALSPMFAAQAQTVSVKPEQLAVNVAFLTCVTINKWRGLEALSCRRRAIR